MNIDLLSQELIVDEGKKNKVYFDTVGIPTIGVGRNLKDRGLSDDEIAYLLNNDILETQRELDAHLPWWRNMTERRQRALANMSFNLGIAKLLNFKNTLSAMESGNYSDAAAGMLSSKWAEQVGGRAIRLSNMMREG